MISFVGALVGKTILGKVITEKMANIIGIAALFALALAVLAVGKCAYDNSVIDRYESDEATKQTRVEREADANLEVQKDADEAAASERQKEIDDATKGIPDAKPSARQRTRACIELRRQAEAAGKAQPAC